VWLFKFLAGAVDSTAIFILWMRMSGDVSLGFAKRRLSTTECFLRTRSTLFVDRSGNLRVISEKYGMERLFLDSSNNIATVKISNRLPLRPGKTCISYLPVANWPLNRNSLLNPRLNVFRRTAARSACRRKVFLHRKNQLGSNQVHKSARSVLASHARQTFLYHRQSNENGQAGGMRMEAVTNFQRSLSKR